MELSSCRIEFEYPGIIADHLDFVQTVIEVCKIFLTRVLCVLENAELSSFLTCNWGAIMDGVCFSDTKLCVCATVLVLPAAKSHPPQ